MFKNSLIRQREGDTHTHTHTYTDREDGEKEFLVRYFVNKKYVIYFDLTYVNDQ